MRERMRREMERCVEEVEAGGDLLPRFLGFNAGGEMFAMFTPWESEQEKAVAMHHVRLFFAWKQVVSYIMVSEAWVVTREIDDTDRRAPADCEDRAEAIIVNGVSHREQVGLHSRIARDGRLVACQPPVWQEGSMTGRMTDLLPPEGLGAPPPHIAREIERIFAGFPQGRAG